MLRGSELKDVELSVALRYRAAHIMLGTGDNEFEWVLVVIELHLWGNEVRGLDVLEPFRNAVRCQESVQHFTCGIHSFCRRSHLWPG